MYDDDDPQHEILNTVTVREIRAQLTQRISRQTAERMNFREFRDVITGDIVAQVEVGLLAEELPPERLTYVAHFDAPRFATWRDHFRATHRARWWGRLLRLRKPSFVDEPLTHVTTVTVRAKWTYPRATTVLPGRDFGHVVLKAPTDVHGIVRPW